MASLYRKGEKIYVSWWDPNLGKTVNRSTGLQHNRENMKKAKEIAKAVQVKLDQAKEKYNKLGIKRITIGSAIERYLNNNLDKNPNTIYEYKNFFKRLLKTFPADSNCSVLTKLSCEDWLNEIKKLSLQRNTKFSICKNLKKFLNFLFEYNYVPYFKINKDVMVKPEVKEIIIFSDEDITILFGNLKGKNSNFKTLIYILFFTGLRPTDVLNLRVDQIDLKSGVMKYYSQKTKQPYIVPIHKELLPILEVRMNEVGGGRIFNYKSSHEMGKAFRRYIKSVGLNEKGYTLRTFRKTFISLAYENNIELATVSKLVGHSSISTTAKFYHKLRISKQSDELKKFKVNIQALK